METRKSTKKTEPQANILVSSSSKKPKKSKSNYVKKTSLHFNEQEDIQLLQCVKMYGEQWSRISKLLFKSMVQCHKRYL